jgi:hypothetical protein
MDYEVICACMDELYKADKDRIDTINANMGRSAKRRKLNYIAGYIDGINFVLDIITAREIS